MHDQHYFCMIFVCMDSSFGYDSVLIAQYSNCELLLRVLRCYRKCPNVKFQSDYLKAEWENWVCGVVSSCLSSISSALSWSYRVEFPCSLATTLALAMYVHAWTDSFWVMSGILCAQAIATVADTRAYTHPQLQAFEFPAALASKLSIRFRNCQLGHFLEVPFRSWN